ncbi:hypothetical protein MKUB_16260 [Mycobacterium kubicae]|uniref:Secreted protein n=1 Tax=Mycobacterium kubicae TaxID=120959 RepID=A0ABQ1BKD9_9MYCO|nr:hypothetical protein MKUB_16260 [Mycobacterium kubicae]
MEWVALICSATWGRRAHNVTSPPASASTLASTVPHAPAPITATVPVLAITTPFVYHAIGSRYTLEQRPAAVTRTRRSLAG